MIILTLTLNKEPFQDILAKNKVVEYREYKTYWSKRLENKKFTHILFKNGYNQDSPTILIEYLGYITATDIPTNQKYYCLILGEIISSNN